jgi:hypothetical protein
MFNSDNGGSSPGFLILASSTMSGNEARVGGGGIYNEGSLIITDTTIDSNINSFSNGGGGLFNAGGAASLGKQHC